MVTHLAHLAHLGNMGFRIPEIRGNIWRISEIRAIKMAHLGNICHISRIS
jgi:hypothetical protein